MSRPAARTPHPTRAGGQDDGSYTNSLLIWPTQVCQANPAKTSKARQPGQPGQPSCQARPPKTQVKETQAKPCQPQASQAKSSLPSQPQPSQAKSSSPSQPSQDKQGINDSFLSQGAVRGLPQGAKPRSAGPASGPGRGPRSPAALVRPLELPHALTQAIVKDVAMVLKQFANKQ